ncbi:hypothetical protein [Nocardiopsis alborubida]|uniref:Uncharacterized protein n=1 Tax=Nocardiopsis alborubida TaxID=146802 RepID=A0A7X6ML14_9ACTN|nr:hypothetical protein [Nocardiopsis alborubida]NKZ01654.1 hypothetical protein [Nocardiopsis alborubida]
MRPRRERRHTVTPVTPLTRAHLVAAATVVVVVPCVLYPLIGLWTLLWIPAVLVLGALAPNLGDVAAAVRAPTADDATADASPGQAHDGQAHDGRDGTLRAFGERGGARGTRIRPVALPSAAEDYDLVFCAVVHWRWEGHVDLSLRNPVAPAVLAVVTRASELARGVEPGDHGTAECELAARLATETAVTGAGVVVWAEEVSLRLPEEDAERLRRMAGLRKDRELREAVRDAEEQLEDQSPARALPPHLTASPSPRPNVAPQSAVEGGLDAFGGLGPFDEPLDDAPDLGEDDGPDPLPGPGSDVDGEGYESYWWPAEGEGPESAERDVQVAILRGLVDSFEDVEERAKFVHEQVIVLERGGFTELALRIREEYPEPDAREARGTGTTRTDTEEPR